MYIIYLSYVTWDHTIFYRVIGFVYSEIVYLGFLILDYVL